MTCSRKIAGLLLLGIAFLGALPGHARADRRVALVFGNARYSHINGLKNPGNDAPDIAGTLRGLGFEVILRLDSKKGDFDRALAEFSRKTAEADVALFYYAGHGVQYQGKNYLLPSDIEVQDLADVKFQAVDMTTVRSALDESGGVKILILDACRDNPFAKQQMATRSVSGGGLSRGLARIDRTEGMIVAYATAPDQVALDGGGRNSPFAESLIARLKEPGLEIGTMFRRVTADVYERTNQQQRPEVSSSLLNDYFLNPAESDRTAWDHIRDSQDSSEFQKFIRKFPNSPFAREAQFRLDLFERIRRENEERALREAAAAKDREVVAAKEREAKDREIAAAREREVKEREIAAAREREAKDREVAAAREREAKDREVAAAREREAKDREVVAAREREAKDREIAAAREREVKEREIAAACEREAQALKALSSAQTLKPLEEFRSHAICPATGPLADKAIERLRVDLARACEADRKAVGEIKVGETAPLRVLMDRLSCDAARKDAAERIAMFEAAKQKADAACAADRQSVQTVEETALDALKKYGALRDKVGCPDARRELQATIDRVEKRVRETQAQLHRVGCFSGHETGAVDADTEEAVRKYVGRKGGDLTNVRLNEALVSDLKNQNIEVCPSADRPVAEEPKTRPAETAHHKSDEVEPRRHAKRHDLPEEEDTHPAHHHAKHSVAAKEVEPPHPKAHHLRAPVAVAHEPTVVRERRAAAPSVPAAAHRAPPAVAQAPSAPKVNIVHGVGF